ncbi:MAG: hypothetical protein GY895_03745 [Phycisphaera sp.]|nr:hypothetical protein [Phycisphaera sp.]
MNPLSILSSRMPLVGGLLLFGAFANGCDRPAGDAPETTSGQAEATTAPAEVEVAATEEADVFTGPPEPEFIPVERLVITGGTVLSGFQQDATGAWSASVLEDTTIVVENGEVTRLVAASTYQLGLGDVVVTARDRFVMAAPIVLGSVEADDVATAWLEGGRLVDAALSGIGGVALPASVVDSASGRCVLGRITDLQIPGATPLAADPEGLEALADAVAIGTVDSPGEALDDIIRSMIESGTDPIELLARLTENAAAAIARPDLGRVELGSRTRLLVLDGDPIKDPTLITRPHAMTFGDRVMRKAEIAVLRDASDRGRTMREQILALVPDDAGDDPIRRWYTSTQAQVFAGIAAAGPDGDLRFAGRSGQPRFDRVDGRLQLEPEEGLPNLDLAYNGPPRSFEIQTTPDETGLAVLLVQEGREPIEGPSPGPNAPPIVDLAIDLDLRRAIFRPGEATQLDLQELVYGNGPIGLSPRRYRFTPLDTSTCPPCFEGFEQAWRLDIIDVEIGDDAVAAVVYVGFRDGRPSRAKFDAGADAVWVEEYPAVGRPAID